MSDKIDDTPDGQKADATPVGEENGTDPSKGADAENILHFNPWRDFNDAAPAGHAALAGHVASQVHTFQVGPQVAH